MSDPTKCTLCKNRLPCNLPEGERASRCAACQRMTWDTRVGKGPQRSNIPPELTATVEARIEHYAARVEAKLPLGGPPLFEKVGDE